MKDLEKTTGLIRRVSSFLSREGYFLAEAKKDEKFLHAKNEIGIIYSEQGKLKFDDVKPFIKWPLCGGTLFLFFFYCLIGIKNGIVVGLFFFVSVSLVFLWIIRESKKVEVRIANLYFYQGISRDSNWRLEVFGEKFLPKAKKIAVDLEKKFQVKVEIEMASKETVLYVSDSAAPPI